MKTRLVLSAVCTFLSFSCREEGGFLENPDRVIAGSWINVEQGYSPGSGYVTQKVEGNPPLTIYFDRDFEMSSNMGGFTEFRYYRVSASADVIVFYKEDPGASAPDFSGVLNTYRIQWDGSMLKLCYRGCIEGCHLGFRYVEKPQVN